MGLRLCRPAEDENVTVLLALEGLLHKDVRQLPSLASRLGELLVEVGTLELLLVNHVPARTVLSANKRGEEAVLTGGLMGRHTGAVLESHYLALTTFRLRMPSLSNKDRSGRNSGMGQATIGGATGGPRPRSGA